MANADEDIIRVGVVSELPRLNAWLANAVADHLKIRLLRVATTVEMLNPEGIDVLVLAGEHVPLQELIRLVHRNRIKGVIIFSNDIVINPGLLQNSSFPIGWLSAETDIWQIQASVEAVFTGLSVFSGWKAARIETEDNLTGPLSAREIEVLHLIVGGMSNRQIADTLFISQNTVKFHLTNIYLKLGVSRKSEAIRKALSNGIVAL